MNLQETQTLLGRNLRFRMASNPGDLDDVFRLRYSCYVRTGAIPEDAKGRFHDSFDQQRNHFSFLASDASGQNPLATVRISVLRPDLGWTDSPAAHVFGDHPDYQSIAREGYVEANRLCFCQQARRDTFVRLLGTMAAMADRYNVGWLVACPRLEHAHAYRSLFGFQQIAPSRRYFGVNFSTELLAIRRVDLAEFVRDRRHLREAWTSARDWLQGASSNS